MSSRSAAATSLFDWAIVRPALLDSLKKLSPRQVAKNPVMFVVEVGSVLVTLVWLRDLVVPTPGAAPAWFTFSVAVWLWFTVIFANLAEAVAEGRGKAQAAALRRTRSDTPARRLRNGKEEEVPATVLRKGGGGGRGRPGRSRRRRHHRGDRLGRRVGHHRRVGPGHP